MTEHQIRAEEIQPGDRLRTRTWYGTGMQPEDVTGWRVVREVKVGKINVVLTMGDDLGPAVIYRQRAAQVRVERDNDHE
jgi:hypothetical protein